MVINPNLSLSAIGIIVGIYIIIHGIALIALDYLVGKFFTPFEGIMSGVLSIFLGILLIAMPGVLSVILTIALGVWIILSSVNIIKMSITIKEVDSNWFILLLLGILDLIVGAIVLFNPFVSSLSITMFAGIIIMIHSAINIIDMIIIKNNAKGIAKAIEKTFKEAV